MTLVPFLAMGCFLLSKLSSLATHDTFSLQLRRFFPSNGKTLLGFLCLFVYKYGISSFMGEITFNFCFSVESNISTPLLARLHKQVGLEDVFSSSKAKEKGSILLFFLEGIFIHKCSHEKPQINCFLLEYVPLSRNELRMTAYQVYCFETINNSLTNPSFGLGFTRDRSADSQGMVNN